LKIASTEMGSVAEMIDPKSSAVNTGSPVAQWTRYPVTKVAISGLSFVARKSTVLRFDNYPRWI